MASARSRWLAGCGVVVGGGALLTCCGGVGLFLAAPSLVIAAVSSDTPVVATPNVVDAARREAIALRVCSAAKQGGATTLTGDELTALLAGDGARILLRTEAGRLAADVAIPADETGDAWVNISGSGAFVMENGWFQTMSVERFLIGDWDLGTYMRGQDLAMQANENLARQRAQDPQTYEALDAFARIAVEGEGLSVTPAPGAYAGICGGDAH